MGWRIDPTVARRLRAAVATMEGMRRDTGVHRTIMTPPRFRQFLGETLLLQDEDLKDAEAIAQRLADGIGRPCVVPDAIGEANRIHANAVGMALARHMGVDPVRLVMCAYDARARVTDGDRIVEASIVRALGAAARRGDVDEIAIKVTLGKGVTWHRGRLSARTMQLPDSVLRQLPGRTMRSVTDHDWRGWDDISITSAMRRGGSLVIETDAVRLEPVMDGASKV